MSPHLLLLVLAFGCFAVEAFMSRSVIAAGLALLTASMLW